MWEEDLCIWKPLTCAPLSVFVRGRVPPAYVWDMQLSGSATGGECWSVSLFDPRLPLPHNHMSRFSFIVFSLFYSALKSCSPLGISFLGNVAPCVWENIVEVPIRIWFSGLKLMLCRFPIICVPYSAIVVTWQQIACRKGKEWEDETEMEQRWSNKQGWSRLFPYRTYSSSVFMTNTWALVFCGTSELPPVIC